MMHRCKKCHRKMSISNRVRNFTLRNFCPQCRGMADEERAAGLARWLSTRIWDVRSTPPHNLPVLTNGRRTPALPTAMPKTKSIMEQARQLMHLKRLSDDEVKRRKEA